MYRLSIAGFSTIVLFAFFLAVSETTAIGDQEAVSSSGVTPQLQPVLSGLSSPVFVTNAKDGSNRLFILELPGVIKVLQPGASTPTEFLNITDKVQSPGEQGLLGLAFHPQYPSNGRFYVNYTRKPDGATVIAQYTVSSNPNIANTAETILLVIAQPFANHNGGMIEFGPDGYLYIGMGDGGSGNDPDQRAQNIDDLLGKMLRINVDMANGAVPYSSPPDNPFFGATPGRDEIYAIGFRNPFRWSFDRGTGQLLVGDVGQSAREEIDIVTLGGNYGWRVFEGTLCTGLGPASCTGGSFIPPITEYDHSGGRCSIIGGYVYRGSLSTLPQGTYIYGDFCTGEVFVIDLNQRAQTSLIGSGVNISSFGEDEAGEIYVTGLGGTLHKLINTDTRNGSITANPNPIPVCDGSGLGVTTLFWIASGTTTVEVRVGSPTGPLFAHAGPSGSATTGKWVGPGTIFYLQDVSGGKALTLLNTLGTVTVNHTTNCRSGSISANPNPIQVCDGSGFGVTNLSWTSTGATTLEVRVGSPNGALLAHTGSSGSATTGKWVSQGTNFFLQDVTGGLPLTSANTLATVALSITTSGCGNRGGSIMASPNPIQVCDGSGFGVTNLLWNSTGTTAVEVRVGAPNGALFAHTGPSGSAATGKWVGQGTTFFLQDVSGGQPLTAANTLGTITVTLTSSGCPP
jgi:glucose/arabinose dehydrogenase